MVFLQRLSSNIAQSSTEVMAVWLCGGVLVVFLWWCFCVGCVVVFFVMVFFVMVFLWWCFCGGVLVVVFVWWCFGGVFVVVLLQRLSANIAQRSTEVMAVSSNISQSSTEMMAVCKDCHQTSPQVIGSETNFGSSRPLWSEPPVELDLIVSTLVHLFWPAVVRYSVNVNCFWKCLRFKLEKRKVMWMHWFFFSISTFGNLSLSGTDVWLRKFIYAVTFIVFCSNWIFGSGAQCWLAHKVSAFWVEEMDLDDTREIRVNSG